MLESFWHDLRHAARMMMNNPGFAITAIVSIALGVGANVGMFSVADGLVLRPLPVPRPVASSPSARCPRELDFAISGFHIRITSTCETRRDLSTVWWPIGSS